MNSAINGPAATPETRGGIPDLELKPKLHCEELPPGAHAETVCAHYGDDPRAYLGAATPPIFQTSTFFYPDMEAWEKRRRADAKTYDYTRVGNPTTQVLEAKLARLERGDWCDGFGSGMGAITAAINACVHTGAHVVCVAHCYGPTRWYLSHLERFGVTSTYVNSVRPDDFIAAVRPETKLIYLESPTSGRMDVPEIEPVARFARQRGIATIFDNSWASPYFQNPLEFGIDLVVHSISKYINGHSDVIAGCVVGRNGDLRRRVAREVELSGATLDPHAAWLVLRGLRTLPLRMERHQSNALQLARFLERHPKVARVLHPGLESHPQHAVARRQLRGYSGLFSFTLRESTKAAMQNFISRLKLFGFGVSWGGFESIVIGGTFFSDAAGPPEWVIRLSVGLETADDLVADVKQALES